MTSNHPSNLWRSTAAELSNAAALSSDITADLAIVGAGFSGCSAALEAARDGATVAVLEANTVGHGGSGRNVGLVNAGLWLPPDQVVEALGETDGPRLLKALGAGPASVFDIIEREGISCEATHCGTLHLAHAPSGLVELNNRYRQGIRIGAPVQMLDAKESALRTGSKAFHGALFDPRAGTVQPLAYCRGLANAAIRAGASIFPQSAATSIAYDKGVWHLRSNGHEVVAKALLLATNAYPEHFSGSAKSTHVTVNYSQFATATLPKELRARILPGGEGCWDSALVMSSLRIDAAGRFIIGGIGNTEGPGARIHTAWARRKLRALYPELADIPFEHTWSGKISMTSDHIPKIVAFAPNALSIFGYSGRGISPGTLFGQAAAKALLEGTHDALPIPAIENYTEQFTRTRAAYYEFGASLTHALRPLPFGK